jgi:hypothetical protein
MADVEDMLRVNEYPQPAEDFDQDPSFEEDLA